MNPISPALSAKIYQQSTSNNQQVNDNKNNNTSLKKDIVEISTKQNKTKQTIKIAAGIGLVLSATYAVLKQRDLSKAKKELSALYDTLYEKALKDTPEILKFEKPKLIFKKLKGTTAGGYSAATNEIKIDPRSLRRTIINKKDNVIGQKLTDDLEIYAYIHKGSIFDIFKKGASDNYRMATKDEALAIQGATMAHELAHARQFQLLLCNQDMKESYLDAMRKKFKDLSDEEFKKAYSFVYDYVPKESIQDSHKIKETLPDNISFTYELPDILEAFTNYTKEDKLKYYTNLTEVSAKCAEYEYWDSLINGRLPKNEQLSDNFLEAMHLVSEANAKNLVNARNI